MGSAGRGLPIGGGWNDDSNSRHHTVQSLGLAVSCLFLQGHTLEKPIILGIS